MQIKSKKYVVTFEAHSEDQYIREEAHHCKFFFQAWFVYQILNIMYIMSNLPVKMVALRTNIKFEQGAELFLIDHKYYRIENYKMLFYLKKKYGKEL